MVGHSLKCCILLETITGAMKPIKAVELRMSGNICLITSTNSKSAKEESSGDMTELIWKILSHSFDI